MDNHNHPPNESREKDKIITTDGGVEDIVIERLKNFKIIPYRFLEMAIMSFLLPYALFLLLLADWLIGNQAFAGDLFRLSGVLTIAFEFIILGNLFNQLQDALGTIWTRSLLTYSQEKQQTPYQFVRFINSFEATMNSRWSVVIGIIGGMIALSATYPVRYFFVAGSSPFDFTGLLTYYLWGNAAIVAFPLGYLLGFLAWRVFIIVVLLNKIGDVFELQIKPLHPDKCGGLKPLGNLSLQLALLLIVPTIFLSIWGFATTFFGAMGELYIQLWASIFRQSIVVASVLSVLVFAWPLYTIHRHMKKRSQMIQVELDKLAIKADEIATELRLQAQSLSPEQASEKFKAVELMNKVYQDNSRIPVWPVDMQIMMKFGSAQIIPILSLIGTNQSVVDLVKSILDASK